MQPGTTISTPGSHWLRSELFRATHEMFLAGTTVADPLAGAAEHAAAVTHLRNVQTILATVTDMLE